MKFSIDQEKLNGILSIVGRCISQKALQDILSNVLIESKENEIIFTAHDHKLACEIKEECEVTNPDKVLVNAMLLSDFVRKLRTGDVHFEKKGKFLHINQGETKIKLLTYEAEEYPRINRLQAAESFSVPSLMLKEMIRLTIFAASNDEKSIHLNSTLMEIEKDSLSLVSCEFYRIAYKKNIIKNNLQEGDKQSYLIPSRATNELQKILQQNKDNEMVDIKMSDRNIEFTVNNCTISTQLIDKDYVDYKKIIPKEYKTRIKIDRKALYDAIDRANLLVRMKEEKSVIFDIKNNTLSVIINSNMGNFYEEIPIDLEGVDLEIGFNPKFIIDVLKVVDHEEVIMEFNSGIRPAILKTDDEDNYIYLVLPMKI